MRTRKQSKTTIPRYLLLAMIAAAVMLLPASQALALTAANTQIENSATLSYNDGAVVRSTTAGVTVIVALVSGVPTLDAPADASTVYTAANTPLNFTYTITAGGNGPDTYTLASTVSAQTNTAGAGATVPASIQLGATVTTAASTTTVLNVPSDGNDADSAVNGIAVNDTVVVAGESRTVTAITDPATGTATITLAPALGAAPAAGVSVFEQGTFVLAVTSGTIATAGTDITVTVATTASSTAGAAPADTLVATYTSGNATLTKYVRNVNTPGGTTGLRSFTVNGAANDYYTAGVTGAPGETLEYLLLVENSGSMDVTACAITDVLPTAFVTFTTDAYGVNEVTYVDPAAAESGLTQEAGDDAATLSGSNLTVNVGAGATSGAGGTLATGESAYVVYQVTIN